LTAKFLILFIHCCADPQYACAALFEILFPVTLMTYEKREAMIFVALLVSSLLFLLNMLAAIVQIVMMIATG
jgi:hypothetical protein